MSSYHNKKYKFKKSTKRKITLATKSVKNSVGKYIDMELKKQRNQDAKALYDK